jgi:2-amino-4-hydroxy-6-hydroxymethyldihydropteridine diphosphokinase
LGSNVGDRGANLRDAIARLKASPGVNFLRVSRVYQTAPIGVTDQPEFLNMVVEVEVAGTPPPLPPPRTRRGGDVASEMSARELLALVKQIETEVGRKQRERWGPREIDIDVLLFGDEHIVEGDLEVPHPRMWERAFVLAPLAELAPEMKTPSGETVAEVAERLGREQGVAPFQAKGTASGATTSRRPGQKVWDWLPAVTLVAIIFCAALDLCVVAAVGPFASRWFQAMYYGFALVVLTWIVCAMAFLGRLVRRRDSARTAVVKLLLVAAVPLFLWFFDDHPVMKATQKQLESSGLRRVVTSRVSVEELEAAAATMLRDRKHGTEPLVIEGQQLRSTRVPAAISRLEPDVVTVLPTTVREAGYVRIAWLDWGEWGLAVGPPGFVPKDAAAYERWADGVYSFIWVMD